MNEHLSDHLKEHIPAKRQSVLPDRAIWLSLVGLAVILAIIALAVGLASRGDSSCPTAKPGAAHSKCS